MSRTSPPLAKLSWMERAKNGAWLAFGDQWIAFILALTLLVIVALVIAWWPGLLDWNSIQATIAVLTLGTFVLSACLWLSERLEAIRLEKEIAISIKTDDKGPRELPLKCPRGSLARGELKGLFNEYLGTSYDFYGYYEQVVANGEWKLVHSGKQDVLTVKLTPKDYDRIEEVLTARAEGREPKQENRPRSLTEADVRRVMEEVVGNLLSPVGGESKPSA